MASFVAWFNAIEHTHETRCETVWIYQTCRESAVKHKIRINTQHQPRTRSKWLGTAPPATERARGAGCLGPCGCAPRGHQRNAHRGDRAGEKTQGSRIYTQGKKPNCAITTKNCYFGLHKATHHSRQSGSRTTARIETISNRGMSPSSVAL